MGAEASKGAGTSPKFSNLDSSQVEMAKNRLLKFTGGAKSFSRDKFVSSMSALGRLAEAVFDTQSTKGQLTILKVLQIADALNGDAADMSQQLLAIHGSTAGMLKGVVGAFSERCSDSSDALLEYLLSQAPPTDDRLHKWIVSGPLLSSLVRYVYSPLWLDNAPSMLPRLSEKSSLMTAAGALAVLNANLPMERRKQWTKLFSSVSQGSSFSQMNKRVNGEGPCLVVVQTEDERIFGCFASDGFVCGPQYRGNATCFLFELAPSIRIHAATGMTSNYAYLNCQQSSLPNGLGMGGYEDIWPFFIHEEYGSGISRSALTSFERCCLAGKDSFRIKNVEVWRVGEKPKLTEEEEQQVRKEKSIIDKDPEARAILEMSGRKMHSEAYRDPEPILDED